MPAGPRGGRAVQNSMPSEASPATAVSCKWETHAVVSGLSPAVNTPNLPGRELECRRIHLPKRRRSIATLFFAGKPLA